MGQSVVKNTKKLFSQGDLYGSANSRITNLEQNEYKVTYYEIITGASGSLTLPTGATINSDEFGLSGDCILSKIDGFNKPTFESPVTSGTVVVTANLNTTNGTWTASGAYTDSSIALIYSIHIKAIDYHNLTYSKIIETIALKTNSAVWGGVIGTLSAQTDLQNALNLKADKVSNLSDLANKAAARVNLGFEVKTTFGNANYTALITDKEICTSVAFTAPRIVTLVAGLNPGQEVIIADEFQTVTSTNTLTIKPPTGKKLNGVVDGTEVIGSAGGWRRFFCDGSDNYIFDACIVRLSYLTPLLLTKADKQDGIVSGGVITIGTYGGTGTNNDIRIAACVWYLSASGVNFSTSGNTDFLDFTLAAAGMQRYIGLYGDSTNTITKVEGVDALAAAYPATPSGKALLGYVLVGDSGAVTTSAMVGYLLKASKASSADNIAGTDDTLYITPYSARNVYCPIAPRVSSITSSATPAFNVALYDEIHITAQAAAITSMTSGVTGTPGSGQVVIYQIVDNGTARAITWGTKFTGPLLPTTTIVGQTLSVGLKWDSSVSKFRCLATDSQTT